MRNKNIIIIVIAIIIILIIMLVNNKNNKEKANVENISNEIEHIIENNYNVESGLYEIVDKSTGEILYQTLNEEEAQVELNFYKQHPDYRATPPGSTNLK